ncbi:RNA polymerase sigma-70 factor, ECF subfamily [Parapedobacter koreensis]|uniref:RNA polymerase sigma-70 factor, ECF subfamily n=1 Tax=Parapedobacter koreensis TaxID=332977 RepID=A0A1H7FU35_9SPHI|nr:RNA polymerase sigma-70 factor, ECF subfamily [Parapedobacter koreensis]
MLYFAFVKTAKQGSTQIDVPASDEKLFEQLHEASWSVLFQIACKKLGDRDEAYDLLQELFLELWNKRDVFPLHGLSLAWLKKRLWYKLITYFRTQGFQQRHLENFRLFIEREHPVVQPDESLGQVFESQFELIMDAIALTVAQMPERMQEVFLLNREQQFTINEIALRLGLSPNTVRNHLHAAMKRLRKSLEAQNLSALCIALLWWIISG